MRVTGSVRCDGGTRVPAHYIAPDPICVCSQCDGLIEVQVKAEANAAALLAGYKQDVNPHHS